MKIAFKNDYSEGAHPSILERMVQTNLLQQAGYGFDEYTLAAKARIAALLDNPESQIYFVCGGTQTNLLVISHLLRPYESVIACDSGHIVDTEAGAIEATGHKIHLVPSINGKIQCEDIRKVVGHFSDPPHQVKPRLVYISNATELGSIYRLSELKAIYNTCHELGLLLFMDGARLAHALNANGNDIHWDDLAHYTDAFYIGGTKNGALLGEAIVLNKKELQIGFDHYIKQKGALLAKGRLLGIQFLELFENDLLNRLARHANVQADRIRQKLVEKGVKFLSDSPTNQLFPILTNAQVSHLDERFEFYHWAVIDPDHTAIRLICSWATTTEEVDQLLNTIDECF